MLEWMLIKIFKMTNEYKHWCDTNNLVHRTFLIKAIKKN